MILGERMLHPRPVAPPLDEPIEGIDRMIQQRFIIPLSHIYFLVDKSDSIKSYIFYLYVGNSSSFNDNKYKLEASNLSYTPSVEVETIPNRILIIIV